MVVGLVVAVVFLGGLIYLLFAPIYIEFDSREAHLLVRFHRLVRFRIEMSVPPKATVSSLGWNKTLEMGGLPLKSTSGKQNKGRKKGRRLSLQGLMGVIQSFRIIRCYIDIDFGDMRANGIVYPLFWWIKWARGLDVNVNFVGRTVVVAVVKNNLVRMVRAYIARN